MTRYLFAPNVQKNDEIVFPQFEERTRAECAATVAKGKAEATLAQEVNSLQPHALYSSRYFVRPLKIRDSASRSTSQFCGERTYLIVITIIITVCDPLLS